MPNTVPDHILVVESDPVVGDLIGRQALQSAGYKTTLVSDASAAINAAISAAPDIIITNITLPGLSGKDLMVALNSQGLDIPVIILAQKGSDMDIIQSFRLGAVDFLLSPLREAEILAVVERVIKQVHARRERQKLESQVQQTNQELQQRVNDLTTIFAIGKTVTSVTDQALLFERLLEGAARATHADLGWFLLRDEVGGVFLLAACRNLPPSLTAYLHQTWDDGISSLVAMSGEPLAILGEPLSRFKIATLGRSALVTPVKAQKQVIGLLVLMRKQEIPFSKSEQNLLEAVADYASISIMNARLFRTLEERARLLQKQVEGAQAQTRVQIRQDLSALLGQAEGALQKLARSRLDKEQKLALEEMQKMMQAMRNQI